MLGPRRTHPSYGLIKPYSQGDLSSFCGIYAALNAARLVSPERANDRQHWKLMYAFAVARLSASRQLKQGLTLGLTCEAWKAVLLDIYDELSALSGMSYRMRPLIRRGARSERHLFVEICKAIDAERVVLSALCGTHDHYTVLAGYTASRWLLQDSQGMRWIEMKSTSLGCWNARQRHWIPSTSLVVLYRQEKLR